MGVASSLVGFAVLTSTLRVCGPTSASDTARTRCRRCPDRDAGRSRDRRGERARHRPRGLRRSSRTRRFGSRIWPTRACFRAGTSCAVVRTSHHGSGTPRSSCWCGSRSCRGHRRARWPGWAVPVQAAMEVPIASSPLCALQLQFLLRRAHEPKVSCAVVRQRSAILRRRCMTLRLCTLRIFLTVLGRRLTALEQRFL